MSIKTAKSQNSKKGVVRQNSVSISDFLGRVDRQVFRAMMKIAIVFHELEETFLPEIFNEENDWTIKLLPKYFYNFRQEF